MFFDECEDLNASIEYDKDFVEYYSDNFYESDTNDSEDRMFLEK